jgi:ribonuclease J
MTAETQKKHSRKPRPHHRGKHSSRRGGRAFNSEQAKQRSERNPNAVYIIPLGGFEEVGRNMMLFEHKNDIVIIDMGLQFPEEETPGIDYIIPNITYLKGKEKNIRGVIITHGHYDHIGAIPHIMDKIGNPTIYATKLTAAVIQKRQEDFPNKPKLDIEHITEKSTIKLGAFTVSFFPVQHNIPEGVGMEIRTPVGTIVHPGEFKFHYDREMNPIGTDIFQELGKKEVTLLMLDSTNAEEPGRSVPEWRVEEEIERLIKNAEGRVIISTFASLLDRLSQIVNIGGELGRKIAITGRSMESNFAIAQELGLIKVPKGTIISIKEISKYHPTKVLILTTGAQGEEFAGLTRIAAGTHRDIKVQKDDTIIFSSSIVPGNEMAVQILRDGLARQGATVYHYKNLDIHSGGHAKRDELIDTIKMVSPRYFMPIHGFFYMRTVNAHNAIEAGIPKENTLIGDNGQVIEVTQNGVRVLKETVPTSYVMVDGLGVGDVGTVVLRDRQHLAEDGMFVVITVINSKSGKVIGNPDIISRGFVYLRESKELLREVRKRTRSIVESETTGKGPFNEDLLKEDIRKKIGQFLYAKTQRRPMLIPVIIEV